MKTTDRSAQARRELDRRFRDLDLRSLLARPRSGWIRPIREALGMSQAALADRLAVTPAAISQLEHAELSGGITIAKLREAASALDCTLVYGLVPNTSLDETVKRQARRVAAEQLAYVSGTMALEDQAVSSERETDMLETHSNDLIAKGLIWPRRSRQSRSR